jgi:hypothetical protein
MDAWLWLIVIVLAVCAVAIVVYIDRVFRGPDDQR